MPDGEFQRLAVWFDAYLLKQLVAWEIYHKCQRIQVATSANLKNAERTSFRMQRINFPTVKKSLSIQGEPYQIVYVVRFFIDLI